MKEIIFKIGKITLLFVIIFVFLFGTVKYTRLLLSFFRANVSLLILRDPSVLDVEILYDAKEYGIKNREYDVRIFFNDGGSLEVRGVNENGSGDNMHIYVVNEFIVGFLDVTTRGATESEIKRQIYSIITGARLETITDILRNYNTISQYEKSLSDLNEYKISDNENIREVIERLYAENILLNETFFVDGIEYYPHKIHLSILLPWYYAEYEKRVQ